MFMMTILLEPRVAVNKPSLSYRCLNKDLFLCFFDFAVLCIAQNNQTERADQNNIKIDQKIYKLGLFRLRCLLFGTTIA